MSIKGLSNSFSLPIDPNALTEAPSQQQDPSQNSVMAENSADLLEPGATNPFELLQQSPNPEVMEQSSVGLDAYVKSAPIEQNTKLEELQERLKQLRERREELNRQLTESKQKILEMREAAAKIREALDNDEPLSEEALSVISALGGIGVVAGILAGLPVVSFVSGIFGGLSEAYKAKLQEANAKLQSGMEQEAGSLKESADDFDSNRSEEETLRQQIEQEKFMIEHGDIQTSVSASLVTGETQFRDFVSPENMVKSDLDE